MIRKLAFGLMIAMLLLISTGGMVSANNKPPAFQIVFQPEKDFNFNPAWSGIWATETFNNELYVTAGDYYHFWNDPNGLPSLHLFHSRDGKNWKMVDIQGIDPNYLVGWDMLAYKDYLYLAIHDWGENSPHLPGLIARTRSGADWEIVFQDTPDYKLLGDNLPDKFGVFNGMIYFTTEGNGTAAGQIWRSRTGNPKSWELVNGNLGDGNYSTSSPVEFKGALYLSGTDAAGMHVWHSPNGKDWDQVDEKVLADPANVVDEGLAVYGDSLYLSTSNYFFTPDPNYPGGRIYQTKDGIHWSLMVDQGFGNPGHPTIDSLFVFKGELYAMANTTNQPPGGGVLFIYRLNRNQKDWELVTPNGVSKYTGSGRNQQAVFKGNLYFASSGCNEDCSDDNSVVYKMIDP